MSVFVKFFHKIAYAMAVTMLLAFMLSAFEGCYAPEDGADNVSSTYEPYISLTAEPLHIIGYRKPLALITKTYKHNGCNISYPYVCNERMDMLNISIREALSDFVGVYGSGYHTDYETLYNNNGLLSLMVYLYSTPTQKLVLQATLNFDTDTGKGIVLSDCFGTGDISYKYTLPDLITQQAEAMGYTLISFMEPVGDRQLFYFTNGGIVFFYREYELCTAEAGCPAIAFKLSSIRQLLNSDALLWRLS